LNIGDSIDSNYSNSYSNLLSHTKNLILPLGISFFTFQITSYTIDVFRDNKKLCKSLIDFSLFGLFFPQLIAGPIMRSTVLINQFKKIGNPISSSCIYEGHYYFFRGLVKKVIIADFIGVFVDTAYGDLSSHSLLFIIIVSVLFGFQIYFDFSGYSDIAIGLGKYFWD